MIAPSGLFGTGSTRFFDDQDISTDIKSLYNSFIREIDSYRSHFNPLTAGIKDSIDFSNVLSIVSDNNSISGDPLESRCNTFYRLIGLPVIDSQNRIYSPGFSGIFTTENSLENKIQISNDILNNKNLKSLLDIRQNYSQDKLSILQKQDLNSSASVVALQYIVKKPFFNFENNDDVASTDDPDQQKYTLDGTTIKEGVIDILTDAEGNKPTVDLVNRRHVLKPFIVDPRIDFTTLPQEKTICAPFLPTKQHTQLRENVFLKRPYIEKIIETRLLVKRRSTSVGTYSKFIIDFIKQDSSITDNDILFKSDIDNLNNAESVIISKFFKLIKFLVSQLVKHSLEIKEKTSNINWVPIPDKRGLEFLMKMRDIVPQDPNNKKIEKDILDKQVRKVLDEMNFDLGLNANKVNAGDFLFSGIDDIIFGSFNNVSTIYDKEIQKLEALRKSLGGYANQAATNIEIITGENSGLGLIDIVVILTALWLIDIESLLDLIDNDAAQRALTFKDKSLSGSEQLINRLSSGGRHQTALGKLNKKVGEILQLVDKIRDDFYNKNSK